VVYLKDIQKITPTDVSMSGTTDKKCIGKNLRGASAPFTPLDPPMIPVEKIFVFDINCQSELRTKRV